MSEPGKLKAAQRARLEALGGGPLRLGPATVHVDLTNACNTDCVTCWDHSPHLTEPRPASWKRQRKDTANVTRLLDDLEQLGGLEAIILSGMGEPFTHPGIYDIIADVKRRGLHLTIITNLAAADPARVLELGVDELLLGIHGASVESYLAFHPSFSPRHWDLLHDGLRRFQAAGRRYKHVQVICRTNAHEVAEMVELAHRYEARQLNFKLASLKSGTEAVRIDEAQRAWLLEEGLPRARLAAEALSVKTNLDVFAQQVMVGGEATAPIEDIGCFLGTSYSRVTVDDTVLYCCNTEVVVGRLDERTRFSDLWRGDAWQALRARLARGEFFPGCHQCGKLNQNQQLSARYRAAYGEAQWREVSGHAARARRVEAPRRDASQLLRVLP